MAVFGMPKPTPKPTTRPQLPPVAGGTGAEQKPGYGSYTRPQQPAKPAGPGGPLTANNPTATTTPSAPAFQPVQYTPNPDGSPLSFQEQLRQQLNARGANLPAPQPSMGAPAGGRMNALQGGVDEQARFQQEQAFQNSLGQVGQAATGMNALGSTFKPPQQDMSKPAQLPPQQTTPVGPGYAGAETGFQGQINPSPSTGGQTAYLPYWYRGGGGSGMNGGGGGNYGIGLGRFGPSNDQGSLGLALARMMGY